MAKAKTKADVVKEVKEAPKVAEKKKPAAKPKVNKYKAFIEGVLVEIKKNNHTRRDIINMIQQGLAKLK